MTDSASRIAPTADFQELLDALVRLEEALGIAAQKNDIVQGRKLRDKADASRKAVEDYAGSRNALLAAQCGLIDGLRADLASLRDSQKRLRLRLWNG